MNAPRRSTPIYTHTPIPAKAALYCRVSSEDQAERDTIQAQIEFLRQYAGLYKQTIVDEYTDEGISSTTSLRDRPEGLRLLNDAKAGRFTEVLVYRVDRLGRSLRVLLEAHDALQAAGVTIKSVTEPFETGSAIGMFLFSLLGSMAALEKATISERTALGRHRIARQGRLPGGCLPFGYTLDQQRIVPSYVPYAGTTEAEFVRDLFNRIADGSALFAECQRLNDAGIKPLKRFSATKTTTSKAFYPARLSRMLHSPAYIGELDYDGITIPIPAIIERSVFTKAQQQLESNLHKKPAVIRQNLLRGKLKCTICGRFFVCRPMNKGKYYYKCNSITDIRRRKGDVCPSKYLPADYVEQFVWRHIERLIEDPDSVLRQSKDEIKRRRDLHYPIQRRKELLKDLQNVTDRRRRLLEFVGRGNVPFEDAEAQLEILTKEETNVKQLLQSIQAEQDLLQTYEDYITRAEDMLAHFRANMASL
jgi:site-specific DNA recombinase